MTTKIHVLNEGPQSVCLTENGVNLHYIKPGSFYTTLVYNGRAVTIGEVKEVSVENN